MGSLSLVSQSIEHKVGTSSGTNDSDLRAKDEAVEMEALCRRNETRALYVRLSLRQISVQESLVNLFPSSSTAARP